MKKLSLKHYAIITAVLLSYFIWVFIPPYPQPTALVGLTHSSIAAQFGEPNAVLPDKFISWHSSRGIFTWVLQTDAPAPINLSVIACSVSLKLLFLTPLGSYPVYERESNASSCKP